MRITQSLQKIKLNRVMDIAVDVHKDTLNMFFETGGKEYSDECGNRSDAIGKKLKSYHEIALKNGMNSLRIICEPTGQYQNKLFRMARRMGFFTNFVNAESVAKFRVIETNDTGKTDIKDPRVIRTLGKLDKVIKHRMMAEEYLVLRKLNGIYDECDVAITAVRCRLDTLLLELFCDYSFKKDFLYTASGFALIDRYGCNPYRIVETGFKTFCSNMREAAPRIQQKTLQRLWDDAQSSILNEQPEGYIKTLEAHLRQLAEDWSQQMNRKGSTVERMKEVLRKLREKDSHIPPATFGVINDKNMARLLGETGPLSDFANWRMLLRYGGLNLRMRQSGRYLGQSRITKRGRPLMRKVLQHIVLPLVKKGCLYGEYYHRKKEVEMMPGNKAMTAVARHFLKKFYGWYKSGEAFDKRRFFSCETQYMKAA